MTTKIFALTDALGDLVRFRLLSLSKGVRQQRARRRTE
jgi:hypothetical protein